MMKIQVFLIAGLVTAVFLFSSCESCVQKAAKKATDLGVSAIEGVSESIAEHGEKTGEKVTDALGAILKGAGKSIERQLDEHAEHVAYVTGRTFVQALDGFEDGLLTEYYDAIPHEDDFTKGVALQQYGKIKGADVVDAYFIIPEQGNYTCQFDFVDADSKVLLTRGATVDKTDTEKKVSVVSIGLNSEEKVLFDRSVKTRIRVTKN